MLNDAIIKRDNWFICHLGKVCEGKVTFCTVFVVYLEAQYLKCIMVEMLEIS